MAAIARCPWMLLLSVHTKGFPPWGKDSPAPGEVARSARRGTGGTKCRMRGEQPLAPSSGAPSFVCSLRSQPPVPRFVTCGDISPRSGENLPPTGGRLQWRPAAEWLRAASSPSPSLLRKSTSPKGRGIGSTAKSLVLPRAPPLGELSPQVTERARTLSSGQWSVTIHDPPPRTTTILQQYGLPFSALRGTIT